MLTKLLLYADTSCGQYIQEVTQYLCTADCVNIVNHTLKKKKKKKEGTLLTIRDCSRMTGGERSAAESQLVVLVPAVFTLHSSVVLTARNTPSPSSTAPRRGNKNLSVCLTLTLLATSFAVLLFWRVKRKHLQKVFSATMTRFPESKFVGWESLAGVEGSKAET